MTDIDPVTSTEDVAETRRHKSRGVRLFIRDIVLIVVAAIVISVGIKAFLIRSRAGLLVVLDALPVALVHRRCAATARLPPTRSERQDQRR